MKSDDGNLLQKTEAFVKSNIAKESSHDWWHIDRVRRIALLIAEKEQADHAVVELAALLHDVADWKFHDGDELAGSRTARRWLSDNHVGPETIEAVCRIIDGVSFKGAGVVTDMPTLEGQCVQDADRLDAIGAIGIARAFAFGGHFGRVLYDPEIPASRHDSFAAYQSSQGSTLNHFHEKLLLLKDRMQTGTGKRLAMDRHHFMELFLERFLAEWNLGTDC